MPQTNQEPRPTENSEDSAARAVHNPADETVPEVQAIGSAIRDLPAKAASQESVVVSEEKLAKTYEPQQVEDRLYGMWEKSGFFNPDNLPGERPEPFTVMMPPPNATGTLHVGHAMFVTLQDIMTRFNRMRGKAALWLPGTDHASIATSTKVEKIIAKEGLTKYDLGRDGFLNRVNEFVAGSQSTIRRQVRKMGASCDWSREAYTLDEPRSVAVTELFRRMYADGLIYRGYRIVNWCPRCESTLADDEVDYKEQDAKLYYMKYGPFTVATTRPETKLGDTGVAVNPDDERYRDWVGKTFTVDFGIGEQEIRVIADREVDMEFGSGVVGLTPAHSAVDFAMAEKNGLTVKKVIGEDGKMTDLAGKYAGLPVEEARAKFVADLEARGLIEKIEDFKNNLSVCYRCAAPIEPLTSRQWFVNVNKPIESRGGKSLKELSLEAVHSHETEIMPERFEKVYFHWMENLRDWCISRQIWFGHRIPAWYCEGCHKEEGNEEAEGLFVGATPPDKCSACGHGEFRQDPDTLDTWFSSGAWTFTTLGWPDDTADLRKFHPTSVLETAYDIIFFWVARMILMSTYVMDEVPFKTVYLHGLVRDDQGRKMSKSLENIIDPLDVSAKYGTDAVRLSLTIGNTPGNDCRISEEKIAYFRNFANKLWNVARFMQMQGEIKAVTERPTAKTLADEWILGRLDEVVTEVTRDLEVYNLSRPAETLRDFTWNELADWYLEIAKIEGGKGEILSYLLDRLLRLWHPFVPFVTEEIYQRVFASGEADQLMVAEWPEVSGEASDTQSKRDFEGLQALIVAVRNIRANYKVEPARKVNATLYVGARVGLCRDNAEVICGLAKIDELTVAESGEPLEQAAAAVVGGMQVFVPLAGMVDLEAERQKIESEIAEAEKYRTALAGKLGNENFVSRAPEAVVAAEREKLTTTEERINRLREQLAALGE